jgi:hypothetical protein
VGASFETFRLERDQLESWVAIHNLVNTYPLALDSRDDELFAQLWHPNGVWDFGKSYGVHEGIEAMLAFMRHSGSVQDTHHLVTNVVIRFRDDTTAYGYSVAYAQVSRHDGPTVFPVIASYQDEYGVYRGRWVFTERRVETDDRAVSPVVIAGDRAGGISVGSR